jgi:hypothetical protein
VQLRFVTHRHISPADIEATLQAFRDLWREAAMSAVIPKSGNWNSISK